MMLNVCGMFLEPLLLSQWRVSSGEKRLLGDGDDAVDCGPRWPQFRGFYSERAVLFFVFKKRLVRQEGAAETH